MATFAKLTGRQYALYEYHGAPDADRVIIPEVGPEVGNGAGAERRDAVVPRAIRVLSERIQGDGAVMASEAKPADFVHALAAIHFAGIVPTGCGAVEAVAVRRRQLVVPQPGADGRVHDRMVRRVTWLTHGVVGAGIDAGIRPRRKIVFGSLELVEAGRHRKTAHNQRERRGEDFKQTSHNTSPLKKVH